MNSCLDDRPSADVTSETAKNELHMSTTNRMVAIDHADNHSVMPDDILYVVYAENFGMDVDRLYP